MLTVWMPGPMMPMQSKMLQHCGLTEGIVWPEALRPSKYSWNAEGSTVADIKMRRRSGRSCSNRRNKVKRKSVCRPLSCTSSTTMWVAPLRVGLLCITFSKIPTVQKTTWQLSVTLSCRFRVQLDSKFFGLVHRLDFNGTPRIKEIRLHFPILKCL